MTKPGELTALQFRTANIFFNQPEKNQKQAYIQAGGKCRGHKAEVVASRMLNNVKVQDYLNGMLATGDNICDH